MPLPFTRPVPQSTCQPSVARAEAGYPHRWGSSRAGFSPLGVPSPPATQVTSGQSEGTGPDSAGGGRPGENGGPSGPSWSLLCWPLGWRPSPCLLSPGGLVPEDVSQAGICKAAMPRSTGSGYDTWPWTLPQVLLTPWHPPRWTVPPGPAPHPREPLCRLELC